MTKRREFSKAVRVEIIRRAARDGQTFCEGCGVACRTWQVDHTIPDGLAVDKSKPLKAEDGKLLCSGSPDSCHGRKTATVDVPTIAKAKRVEAAHLRANDIGPLAVPKAVQRARKEARSRDRNDGRIAVPGFRSIFVEG